MLNSTEHAILAVTAHKTKILKKDFIECFIYPAIKCWLEFRELDVSPGKTYVKKCHKSIKLLLMISEFKLDL